jgi:hypothetical protein
MKLISQGKEEKDGRPGTTIMAENGRRVVEAKSAIQSKQI